MLHRGEDRGGLGGGGRGPAARGGDTRGSGSGERESRKKTHIFKQSKKLNQTVNNHTGQDHLEFDHNWLG